MMLQPSLAATNARRGPPLSGLLEEPPTYAPPDTVQQGREQLLRLSAVGQHGGE